MPRFRFRLTFTRRLLLLSAVPMLGLLGIGGEFLHRLYTEQSHASADARTLSDFQDTLGQLNSLYRQIDKERLLALRVAYAPDGANSLTEFQKQIQLTDNTYATFGLALAQALAGPKPLLPTERVEYIKDPFTKLLPEARQLALDHKANPSKIINAYNRCIFNAIVLAEAHRSRIHNPDIVSFYDGLYTANKMREIEAIISCLFHLGSHGYDLKRDDVGIIRKQYFALTESETYLRRYYPELRTAFDLTLKTDPDSVIYYKYLADLSGSMIDGPLPPFTLPKTTDAYMASRYEEYLKCLALGFTQSTTSVDRLCALKKRQTLLLSSAIFLTLLITLGVNISITRSTRKSLNTVTSTIDEATGEVRAASEQLTGAGNQIADNASSYAAALEEISAALNQISTTVQSSSDHVNRADSLSKKANDSVSTGLTTVRELCVSMKSIETSSQKITQIISQINDISFQTNILALNAAVEAARAGAAGAGFSVVAEEVRRLAHRCAEAAAETAALIEESSRTTTQAIRKSSDVSTIFADISTHVREVGTIVTEVSNNFQQQSEGINHVNSALTQQETVAQSNAAIAEQTAAAALTMSDQVKTLTQSVSQMNHLMGHKNAPSPQASAPATAPQKKPRSAAAPSRPRHRA